MIQKARSMFSDENAVSPVIGVILMVAVTVVLAAVIAGFVFGLGDGLSESPPNADIEFNHEEMNNPDTNDEDMDVVFVDHAGGEAIDGNLVVSFTEAPEGELGGQQFGLTDTDPDEMEIVGFEPEGVNPDEDPGDVEAVQINVLEPRTAGDNLLTLAYDADEQELDGVEMTVTWESDDGDSSTVLAEHEF